MVGISILTGSLSFAVIYAGAHGSLLVSSTVSIGLALCSLGLWWRHRKRQIRRARGIPSAWQAESARNAGQLKHWRARL